MKILALDTTYKVASCALYDEGIVGTVSADSSHRHAETVLPAVQQLLGESGTDISEIDAFAVDVGPGSFTGVRIGVTMVNAFAFATGKKVIPVNSLEVLYERCGRPGGLTLCVVDALNGNAYGAAFKDGVCVKEPCAVVTADFIAEYPDADRVVGDISTVCNVFVSPDALHVAKVAARGDIPEQKEGHPLYLRVSQAERKAAEAKK